MEELRTVLGQLGLSADPAMVTAMLDVADKDGDGHIDYSEFVEFVSGDR